jgi:hypothetical protein
VDLAQKLDTAVGLLTRESKHRARDAEGEERFVTVAPLLLQLREEIACTAGGSGGGDTRVTAAIPLAASALDLLEHIKATVHELWWQTHDLHHGHGRGTLAGELRAWAAVVRCTERVDEAERLCSGWVAAITGLLQPMRRWEILAACPVCLATRAVLSMDLDSAVHGAALCIEFAREGTRGVCRACGSEFVPETLARLVH